jgi:HSF-type DNA-binding
MDDLEEKEKADSGVAIAPDAGSSRKDDEQKLEPSKRAASVTKEGETSEPPIKKSKTDSSLAAEEDQDEKPKAAKPQERLNFPGKLMDLLQREDKPDGIDWMPCGSIFTMNTVKMEGILVKHFQGAKFMSFTRTLNKW